MAVKETKLSFRQAALQLAFESGEILLKHFRKKIKLYYKSEIDLVTEVDRRSQELIERKLKKWFPDHDVLAEEAPHVALSSPYRWLVDPLDGTTNYAHGIPYFSVSIGLEINGKVVLGVVWAPVLGELYVGEKGKGAFLRNGNLRKKQRLRVSGQKELGKALLATGFPYDIRRSKLTNLDFFARFSISSLGVRRAGCASIDLSYVAAGRFDGFWELKLNPWDMAAGVLMIEEAGGLATDFKGKALNLYGNEIAASNRKIHGQMLRVLKGNVKC